MRDRRAERVPQAGGVLDGGEPLDPVLAQAERAAGALELRQHPGDGVLVRGLLRLPLGACAPRGLRHGQRSQQAQQVRHALDPAGAPVGREPLQLGLDLRDDLGVEQLALPSGRNAPVLTRRSVARRCSTESTTAPPSPSAAPASAAVKGPWVRA